MASEKVKVKEVKYLADIIGEWGRWQFMLSIFIFVSDLVEAINNMGYTFHAFNVDYWCDDVPVHFENKTEEMKCFKFTNSSEKCTKWRYDKTMFDATLRSEFDLVCDRSYLASLSQSLYMSGYIVAGTLLAYLSDRYGRRPLTIYCFIINIAANISCALSPNITQYLISRLLVGMASNGRSIAIYGLGVIVLECLGPKHRADIILIVGFGWVFGYCALPPIAIWLRSFRYMQLFSTSFVFVILLFFSFFIRESPRWEIANRRYDKAEITIKKALKMNGKTDVNLKENMSQLKKNIEVELKKESHQRKVNFLDLLKSPNLRKYTFIFCVLFPVNSLMYYGISYNIGDFGGNYFVSFILGGLVEAPGQIACLIALKYMGRKDVSIVFYVLTCVSNLIMIFDNPTMRVIGALLAKFGINSVWYSSWLISIEIYPTVLRNTGDGFTSVVSQIGAITGPFVSEISEVTGLTFIFCFYAAITGICAFLVVFLPETKDREIPDTLHQSENLINNEKENSKNNEI